MKIRFLIAISLLSSSIFGQMTKTSCNKNQEEITNFIAASKYNLAEKNYNVIAANCPNLDENFFLNAEKIFNHNLEFATSKSEKLTAVKKLITVFDSYDKKFPTNLNANFIKKVIFLYDNNLGSKEEIFSILVKNFTKNTVEFSNPRLYYILIEAYQQQLAAKNPKITINDLISKFEQVNTRIFKNQEQIASKINNLNNKLKLETLSKEEISNLNSLKESASDLKNIQTATKELFKSNFSCKNLNEFVTNFYESNKTNSDWLQFISDQLFDKFCVSSENFAKVAIQSNKIKETSRSNFYLGYVNNSKGQLLESENNFNAAANLESNVVEKANIYYTVAALIFGLSNLPKAYEFINKAIVENPSVGKYYLFENEIYESAINQCSKSEFEKKAINWLNAQTIQKAIIAEPFMKNSLQILIDNYLLKAPTAIEIEKSGLAGKTIVLDCFINQKIEIPN